MTGSPSFISLFVALLQMMEQSVILLMQEFFSSESDYPTDLFVWIFFFFFFCVMVKNGDRICVLKFSVFCWLGFFL